METPYFTTRMRGYDRQQVDRAVERIRNAISIGSPPHPDSVMEITFQGSFRGYDEDEVDRYLDQIAEQIRNS